MSWTLLRTEIENSRLPPDCQLQADSDPLQNDSNFLGDEDIFLLFANVLIRSKRPPPGT
jgi:hypothetical protein